MPLGDVQELSKDGEQSLDVGTPPISHGRHPSSQHPFPKLPQLGPLHGEGSGITHNP